MAKGLDRLSTEDRPFAVDLQKPVVAPGYPDGIPAWPEVLFSTYLEKARMRSGTGERS